MTPWVTRLLVANIAVFVLQFMVPGLDRYLAFVPAAVIVRPWTAFTYMFVHAGFMHILFNMIGLYFFGPRLEVRLGSGRFLILYVISGLMGAILSLITPLILQLFPGVGPEVLQTLRIPIVGASGAVFGVLLGYARYYPRDRIYIWGVLPIEARVLVMVLAVASIWFGITGGGNVAHFAHLGGFLGGWLYLRWAESHSPAQKFKKRVQAEAEKRRPSSADVDRWSRIEREGMHPVNRSELDRVMAKIDEKGVGSLTPDERAFLDRFSADS